MIDENQTVCVFCKNPKVIRHGHTSKGNKRYRCRECGKTWVQEKKETQKPDMTIVVKEYLGGKTCRELVPLYQTSPLRINQKIREYLATCPNWEDYLDSVSPSHENKMLYCTGRTFSCQCKESGNNTMFLAMVIDALSTVVVGYEIGLADDKDVWKALFSRMKRRGIKSQIFMANGSKHIEEVIHEEYPDSGVRIYYHKAYRDRELTCCLDRFPVNHKLITDSISAYDSFKNQNFSHYLKNRVDLKLRDILNRNPEQFIKRVKERLEMKAKTRIEGLTSAFQARFEKFHMLKDNPRPLVNGWIAKWMTDKLDIGFSRLSVYIQLPVVASFNDFAVGQKPELLDLTDSDERLTTFAIEIASRTIQIPVFYSRCEMDLEKCNLF